MSRSAVTGSNRSMIASLFHFLGELLADFCDLRADHGHAVALLRVLGEVLLVIVLGDVEGPGGDDLGDDGVIEDSLLREGSDQDRKSTRLNSSHLVISYAVFCLKKKKKQNNNMK